MTLALDEFAEQVGTDGEVTICGLSTRGGAVPGVRAVSAPSGIARIEPEEMILECGAGTPVDELQAALGEHGQRLNCPPGGTIGGALALGHTGVERLGHGAIRDIALQARYVAADGTIVKAGGPTVKNVSGFDLCRLLVGSRGTLGFLGDVIVRTQAIAKFSQWYVTDTPPDIVQRGLYRPASLLWDGERVWALLEGEPGDVDAQAKRLSLQPTERPALPDGGRWSLPPSKLVDELPGTGAFMAELCVGVVHHSEPAPNTSVDPVVAQINARIKNAFDPTGRLNPGVDLGVETVAG